MMDDVDVVTISSEGLVSSSSKFSSTSSSPGGFVKDLGPSVDDHFGYRP